MVVDLSLPFLGYLQHSLDDLHLFAHRFMKCSCIKSCMISVSLIKSNIIARVQKNNLLQYGFEVSCSCRRACAPHRFASLLGLAGLSCNGRYMRLSSRLCRWHQTQLDEDGHDLSNQSEQIITNPCKSARCIKRNFKTYSDRIISFCFSLQVISSTYQVVIVQQIQNQTLLCIQLTPSFSFFHKYH